MTMRSYRHFICPNGHKGIEKTSENDQPYSTMWESVSLTGMSKHGTDSQGHTTYICTECRQPMTVSGKP